MSHALKSATQRRLLRDLLAVLCFFAAAIGAKADSGDQVQLGSNIVVHHDEEARDIVCFACSVQVDGNVHGDIVVFLGGVRITGKSERDVVVFGGNLALSDGAEVGRDVVVFAGSLHNAPGSTIGRDKVVFPLAFLLLPLIVFVGIIALLVWAVRRLLFGHRVVYPMPPPAR